MTIKRSDDEWLLEAIKLAWRCPPSPTAFSVGAIVVDNQGTELAVGFSRETDEHVHAEESALSKIDATIDLSRATLYSTLEPCAERKSRPISCAQLIISRGVGRVVMAWREPSLLVERPRGHSALVAAGVTVIERPDIAAAPYLGSHHSS